MAAPRQDRFGQRGRNYARGCLQYTKGHESVRDERCRDFSGLFCRWSSADCRIKRRPSACSSSARLRHTTRHLEAAKQRGLRLSPKRNGERLRAIALRAFEGAKVDTRRTRFDARQHHHLSAAAHRPCARIVRQRNAFNAGHEFSRAQSRASREASAKKFSTETHQLVRPGLGSLDVQHHGRRNHAAAVLASSGMKESSSRVSKKNRGIYPQHRYPALGFTAAIRTLVLFRQ
jgi:hypothetical protein